MPSLPSQYELSYWEREVYFRGLDVVIIGSGIVGLTAAICLREERPALRVAVFERGPLPIGASTRNAGFACFGSMTELIDDMERVGEDAVWALVEQRWRGLRRLRERVGDQHLAYHEHGGYELFREEDEDIYRACLDRLPAFNRILADITGRTGIFTSCDDQIDRFGFGRVRHLMRNGAEGQLHPGRMVDTLTALARARGVTVHTGLPVHALEDDGREVRLQTGPGWELRADRVLVATNGLARRLLPDLPVVPARNQVLITHPVAGLPVEGCFHYDRGYYYFRNIDGRLLLGGGRHLALETEQTDEPGTTPLIRGALTRLLHEVVLPGRAAEIDRWWSGTLGLGEVKAPIVQRVSTNVAVAVRLGGMGVAIGSLVGEQGARLIRD